jgi:hypothetical protein
VKGSSATVIGEELCAHEERKQQQVNFKTYQETNITTADIEAATFKRVKHALA